MRTVANAALPAVPGSLEADRERAAVRRATPGSLARGRGRASAGRATPGSGRPFQAAAAHTGGHIR